MAQRTLLPALILSAIAYLLCKEAFVAKPGASTLRGSLVSRSAVEEKKKDSEFKIPGLPKKPDMRITNELTGVGQTYDQDRRGNVWDATTKVRRSTEEDPLPAQYFIPFWIIFSLGGAVLLAIQAGNDDSFGGAIGDGSVRYGL
mmetsp:Transcript_46956/g.111787  ORF Transcript_46956/g.111787 Transcript_46956/m.111787 type:complete len:144 (-) Transcript_46956:238-669(-)